MSGALKVIFVLLHGFASAYIQPPRDLHVTVPVFGDIVISWKHGEPNAHSSLEYIARYKTPEEEEDECCGNETHCMFPIIALHRGLRVEVAATSSCVENNETSKWVSKDLSPYPGVKGTAARDLSCQIDIVSSTNCLLQCDWKPGEKAPADTQYHLYYRFEAVTGTCPDYGTESGGRKRAGCRIMLCRELVLYPTNILVHVNGSSRRLEIQTLQKVFHSSNIEVIPRISNFSFEDKGNKRLKWAKAIDFLPDNCFVYEVNIWSQGENYTVTVSDVSYWRENLEGYSSTQHFRVRAVGKKPCWMDKVLYSPWTEKISIEAGRQDLLGTTLSICLTAACIAIFVLCIRFWRVIFPRIPKPRKDLRDTFQNTQSQAIMRCNSWDHEGDEVISNIEEMGRAEKYNISLDYTHVGEYPGGAICKTI